MRRQQRRAAESGEGSWGWGLRTNEGGEDNIKGTLETKKRDKGSIGGDGAVSVLLIDDGPSFPLSLAIRPLFSFCTLALARFRDYFNDGWSESL